MTCPGSAGLPALLAALGALIALVIMLFPLYAVIIASFENNSQLLGTHYNFLPPTPSFANYSAVISTQGGHIVSTLLIGVGTALLTLAIVAACGACPGPVPVPGHRAADRRAAGRPGSALNCYR